MNRKILVIEDDLQFKKLLVRRLELEGYKVYSTGACKIALGIAETEKPDVIVMDIYLTDELSLDFPLHIRQDAVKYGSPSIIAMSGLLGERLTRLLRDKQKSGVSSYLSKPFHFEELIALIKKFS